MIRTSQQLKALVRNMSGGDGTKAQIIIRNYIMERFLERMSVSEYRDNLILKGGVLISALVGIDNRSTMDVDTTIKNLQLSIDSAREIVESILGIELNDGITFEIQSVSSIMDEADYPGIRIMVEANLEKMRTPLKLDFSTGDIITPQEITYTYKLLFEDRTISILAYNLETVLSEKLEAIISRGTANSRMRDFYDVYVLDFTFPNKANNNILKNAVLNTSQRRGSYAVMSDMYLILDEVENNAVMLELWGNYQRKFDYAANVSWSDAIQAVRKLCDIVTKS